MKLTELKDDQTSWIVFFLTNHFRLFVNSKHEKTGEEESKNRSVCFPFTVVVAFCMIEVRKTGCWEMEKKKICVWMDDEVELPTRG